ncbi:hypothetical protein GRJ2_001444000 [Grus japonensis]|uniref:Uncharacterized protein n=1 Tax=Grus japonensis TaxID=30415 RepID=A0ABC9WYY6_GRUJA
MDREYFEILQSVQGSDRRWDWDTSFAQESALLFPPEIMTIKSTYNNSRQVKFTGCACCLAAEAHEDMVVRPQQEDLLESPFPWPSMRTLPQNGTCIENDKFWRLHKKYYHLQEVLSEE